MINPNLEVMVDKVVPLDNFERIVPPWMINQRAVFAGGGWEQIFFARKTERSINT